MLTYKQMLVLLTIMRMGNQARSFMVADLLYELTGRHESTRRGIYGMIGRMREHKYIVTKLQEGVKVHFVTEAGNKALQLNLKELGIMQEGAQRKRKRA